MPEPKTILVVDDVELSDGLRMVLEQRYCVIQARDGQQGYKQIYQQRPELVILDMTPGMGAATPASNTSAAKPTGPCRPRFPDAR